MTTNSFLSRWRAAAIPMMIAMGTLMSAGCNLSDTGLSAYRPPDQYFAVLALEHHAINLSTVAPYDTLTLHTIRTMGDGSVVPGEVTYSVDKPNISVTNGVLKAHSAVTRAVVRVTMTHGTITRTDSAVVSVIGTVPDPLHSFGLRLPAGDSAKIAVPDEMIQSKTIPFVRTSSAGATLSHVLVSLVSSDTLIAGITLSGNELSVIPRRPGRVVLSTSTYAYGVAWRDSLVFTVGWPLNFNVTTIERFPTGSTAAVMDFVVRDFTIGVGGCVLWINKSTVTDIDVQFDDTSHVGAPGGSVCPASSQILNADVGGNIAPYRTILWDGDFANYVTAILSPYRARTFSAPGVFRYRSVVNATNGIVRVCDERNDTTCAPTRLGSWY